MKWFNILFKKKCIKHIEINKKVEGDKVQFVMKEKDQNQAIILYNMNIIPGQAFKGKLNKSIIISIMYMVVGWLYLLGIFYGNFLN